MRAFRNTVVTLGLVNAPAKVFPATCSDDVKLNMCDDAGNPVEQVYRAKGTDTIVGTKADCKKMFKGHMIATEALEAIDEQCKVDDEGNSLKHLAIKKFIPLDKVPFNRVTNWYIIGADPKTPSAAFATIVAAMEASNVAGVCKWMPTSREQQLVLYVKDGILHAVAVAFEADVVELDENATRHQNVAINGDHLTMAKQLIESAFDSEGEIVNTLKDEAVAKRRDLVDMVVAGGEAPSLARPDAAPAPAADLMDVLARSIEQQKAKEAA